MTAEQGLLRKASRDFLSDEAIRPNQEFLHNLIRGTRFKDVILNRNVLVIKLAYQTKSRNVNALRRISLLAGNPRDNLRGG